MADEDDQFALGGVGVTPLGERKAGRPAGALNRKTRALGDYLAGVIGERYRDPATVLAAAMSRTVAEIVEALGCEAYEAEKLRLGAAESLMPYLHGKMPLEVKVENSRLPVLVLELAATVDREPKGAGEALSIGAPWREENQGLSGGDGPQSHGGKSHE